MSSCWSSLIGASTALAQPGHFPSRDTWEKRKPADVGMDERLLAEAIAFAKAQETDRPKDLSDQVRIFGRLIGPMPKDRGDVNGVIIRHGYIVAEFGDTDRVDPTYSVAKSYLSTILGLTIDRGMIKDVHGPRRQYITRRRLRFAAQREDHLGAPRHADQRVGRVTLFGKSHDFLGAEEFGRRQRRAARAFRNPARSTSTTTSASTASPSRCFVSGSARCPSPQDRDHGPDRRLRHLGLPRLRQFRRRVDGKTMKSVSGGTRWGGGLWMSYPRPRPLRLSDAARGQVGRSARSFRGLGPTSRPTPARPAPTTATSGGSTPRASSGPPPRRTSFAALGAGINTIWIDPEHDLVVVWRWHRGSPTSSTSASFGL